MIKVLVISDYRDHHSVRPEAEIFIGLAKMNFKIYVMTYGAAAYVQRFKAVGIEVLDFHPQKKLNAAEIDRIRTFIVQHKIDIIHLFNSKAIINGIQAAKGLAVKVVLYRGYSDNIYWYDPAAYLKYLHPRVDKIFCNSKGVEEHIQRQFFLKNDKTITINKGHRLSWYEGYETYEIRKELGLAADSFLLVNVANNRKMKGIPYLLKAMNRLPEDLPVHLLLIGRNMDNRENLKIIKSGDHADKIHLLGFRKNVLNIVAACDVFVLPSIKGESITKSVIEAMSLGVPAIISDIAGNRELVEHGKSGWVFPSKNVQQLADAILKLYQDKILRLQMGQAAKQHIATHLNTEQTILNTKNLYESLM